MPTWSEADPVTAPLVPVTVWEPDTFAVQTFSKQIPSGEIENVVVAVTSPRSTLSSEKLSAV